MTTTQVLADLQRFKRRGLELQCNEFASPSGPYDPVSGRPLTSARRFSGLRALDPNKVHRARQSKVHFASPACKTQDGAAATQRLSAVIPSRTGATPAMKEDSDLFQSEIEGEPEPSANISKTASRNEKREGSRGSQQQTDSEQNPQATGKGEANAASGEIDVHTRQQEHDREGESDGDGATGGKDGRSKSKGDARAAASDGSAADAGEHAALAQEAVRGELQEAYEKALAHYQGKELLAAVRRKREEEAREEETQRLLGLASPPSSASGEGEDAAKTAAETPKDKLARVKKKMHFAMAYASQQRAALAKQRGGVEKYEWSRALLKPPGARSKLDIEKVCAGVRKIRHPFFQSFSDEALAQLVRGAELESYSIDEFVFTEGEIGSAFYLILSGSASVFRNEQQDDATHADMQRKLRLGRVKSYELSLTHLNDLYQGDGFGELALYSQKAGSNVRSATVCATTDIEVLVVNRLLFNRVKRSQKEKELADRVLFCNHLPHLSKLSREGTIEMASILRIKTFPRKSVIVEQDTTPNSVYFLACGQVALSWTQRGVPTQGRRGCAPVDVASLAPRCLFGEYGALGGGVSLVSFVAQTEVTVFIAKNADFDRLITQSIRMAVVDDMRKRQHALNEKITQVLQVRNVPLKNVRSVLKTNSQNRAAALAAYQKSGGRLPSPRTSPADNLKEEQSEPDGPVKDPVYGSSMLHIPQGFTSRADSNDLPRGRTRYRVVERPWKVDQQKGLAMEKGEILSTHLHRRRIGIPPPVVMRRNWSEVGRHVDETTAREHPQVTLEA